MRFTKVISLALAVFASTAAAGSSYQTVKSNFSSHAIRYKSWSADDTALCDGGSAHHTGWVDLEERHLFFCEFSPAVNPSLNPDCNILERRLGS